MQNFSKIKFSILTLFPEMFSAIKDEGVIARGIEKKILEIETIFLRDFATDARKNVDDRPAGGGDGMVIKANIAEQALLSVKQESSYIVNLTPTGKVFCNEIAKELANKNHLILFCGRYAGVDQRFVDRYVNLNLSVGDYVLSGGELPAMCLIDAVSRFIPGVLGNAQSAEKDSFAEGLLEAPCYTKPDIFHNVSIPDILLSGDHKKITAYSRREQLRITAKNRPDLLLRIWDELSRSEKSWVEKFFKT